MANSLMSNMLKALRNKETGGFVTTPQEMKENQFGFPLRHYAQRICSEPPASGSRYSIRLPVQQAAARARRCLT